MRLLLLPLLSLCLILLAPTAFAQESNVHIFANRTCSPAVPCVDQSFNITSTQWAAVGSACVTQTVGATSPAGFFDDTIGLNENGCLVPLPNTLVMGQSHTQLTPRCCVVKVPSGACMIHCDITN